MWQFLIISALFAESIFVTAGPLSSSLHRNERAANNAVVQTGLSYNSNCDATYKTINSSHTMCLVDVGVEVPLTQSEKVGVLNAHNQYRTDVSPTATNMQKMVWDDELAKIATKWAQQCRAGHDEGHLRSAATLPSIYVGQNVAAGYSTFVGAVGGWHDEVADYGYGIGSINGKVVGHYTQVVHHRSARVGCGKASCNDDYGTYYVCNYGIGQGSITHPYTNGTSCSACASNCNDKLCDCNGKLCYNGGTLDLNTCTCSCQAIYNGANCENLQCNNQQSAFCANANPSDCSVYSNYPYDCNMLCGVCPYPCDGKKCLNGGTLDVDSCQCTCKTPYIGDTCQTKNCTGTETNWCSQANADDCKVYSNYPSDCPILCGICPKPCDGKVCSNGGTLNVNTCSCSCSDPYTGATCTEVICDADKSWCSDVPKSYCTMFSNMPKDCTDHCGLCN